MFEFFSEVGILQQLSQTRLERRLPKGMSYAQFALLTHLIRTSDGRTPSQLARDMQVPKASMTNTLAGLERGKLIEVRPNPKDGRGRLVYLTAAGRRIREEAIERITPEFDKIRKRFDAAKLAPLMPVLGELREVMDLYRDED